MEKLFEDYIHARGAENRREALNKLTLSITNAVDFAKTGLKLNILNWRKCQKQLEDLGFVFNDRVCELDIESEDEVWEIARYIYDFGLNVMIRKLNGITTICVDDGAFGQS